MWLVELGCDGVEAIFDDAVHVADERLAGSVSGPARHSIGGVCVTNVQILLIAAIPFICYFYPHDFVSNRGFCVYEDVGVRRMNV